MYLSSTMHPYQNIPFHPFSNHIIIQVNTSSSGPVNNQKKIVSTINNTSIITSTTVTSTKRSFDHVTSSTQNKNCLKITGEA